jgi:hypothetical protein
MPAPNGCSLILANSAQVYNLDTLIGAKNLPGVRRPQSGFIAQFLSIQSDPANQSAKLAIGTWQPSGPQTLSLTSTGSTLFAGQALAIYSMDSNLINLFHIALYTDTPGIQVNVLWLTR